MRQPRSKCIVSRIVIRFAILKVSALTEEKAPADSLSEAEYFVPHVLTPLAEKKPSSE